MAMDVEAEIRDLKRRVSELEGSFGFPTRQIKGVHKDLLTFQERTEHRFRKIDSRFDEIDGRFTKTDDRLDRIEGGLRRLREDMPSIVGEAMRSAMRAPRKKSRNKPQ